MAFCTYITTHSNIDHEPERSSLATAGAATGAAVPVTPFAPLTVATSTTRIAASTSRSRPVEHGAHSIGVKAGGVAWRQSQRRTSTLTMIGRLQHNHLQHVRAQYYHDTRGVLQAGHVRGFLLTRSPDGGRSTHYVAHQVHRKVNS